MVVDRVVFVLSFFCLHVGFTLPLFRETPEISRSIRSVPHEYPQVGHFDQDAPLLSQWDSSTSLRQDEYLRRNAEGGQRERRFSPNLARPLHESYQAQSRTVEDPNNPAMGLAVLSDLRRFFNDLRVNVDSVEEAAALSHEQANYRTGSIDPADFLAFLAKHGARSAEVSSEETGLPGNNPQHSMRRLMFGYNHDDQPYAHSGLGK